MGGPVIFEDRVASLVLVKHDAQRCVERDWQLVLGHSSGGERIAEFVLHGLAREAGNAQQSAMIPGAVDRKLRTALQRLLRPTHVPLPQCLWDGGIERGYELFERRLNLRKGFCGFDFDMLDVNHC
jgi:hypothetical protein